MPTFSVLVTAFTTMIVEAKDGDAALETASEMFTPRGMELDEMRLEHELKTPEEVQRAIEASEWHRSDYQKVPYGV
jgi:hypothetical protein